MPDDDVDEAAEDEHAASRIAEGAPARLPTASAAPDGPGSLVPATPGLRVPDAGYWTRARLDTADMLLGYTWAAFLPTERAVVLRIEAVRRGAATPEAQLPIFRTVIPIQLPDGTDMDALGGLTLGAEALAGATASIRTTARDTWQISLARLTLDAVRDAVVSGSLEGVARRGAQGQRTRRFEAAFIALRASIPAKPPSNRDLPRRPEPRAVP